MPPSILGHILPIVDKPVHHRHNIRYPGSNLCCGHDSLHVRVIEATSISSSSTPSYSQVTLPSNACCIARSPIDTSSRGNPSSSACSSSTSTITVVDT